MKADLWLALGILALLANFIFFAFRQGFKTKPNGRDTRDNVRDAIDIRRDSSL